MTGTWLVDGSRIATKIKSASSTPASGNVKWTSNPTRVCPNCQHVIDNNDVNKAWPGLPGGVKFDPTDQEILWHLSAKAGIGDAKPHPFINEFVPTVDNIDGICYTHPGKLPGVRQDGSASHFFHKAVKAYTAGTRKKRKIQDDDFGDVRWHKTGRTKPVTLDGVHLGWKKIMVLYMNIAGRTKDEKTNWIMHQYHLGEKEDEEEGHYVISKIFYQRQHVKQNDQTEHEFHGSGDSPAITVDPVTPKSATPEPPRVENWASDFDALPYSSSSTEPMFEHHETAFVNNELQVQVEREEPKMNMEECESKVDIIEDNHNGEERKWWDSESQHLLDSQQLVEGLSLCDEFLQSQEENEENGKQKKNTLSEYAKLGPEYLKKDLIECQNLVLDPAIELDTPPEFRLSQLDFGSQESFTAWGGNIF